MKIFLLFIVVYLYHIEASTNFILKVNDTGCAIRARSTPTSGVIKFISKGTVIEAVSKVITDKGIESYKITSGGWIVNMNNIMVVEEQMIENEEEVTSSSSFLNQFNHNNATTLPITTHAQIKTDINANTTNYNSNIEVDNKSKTITIPNTISTDYNNNNHNNVYNINNLDDENYDSNSTFQAITTLFFSFDTSAFGFTGQFSTLPDNDTDNDKKTSSPSASIAAKLKEELSTTFPDNVIRSPFDKIFAKSNIIVQDNDENVKHVDMITTTTNGFYMNNINHIRKILDNSYNSENTITNNDSENDSSSTTYTLIQSYITKMVDSIATTYQNLTACLHMRARAIFQWDFLQPLRDLAAFDAHNDLWH